MDDIIDVRAINWRNIMAISNATQAVIDEIMVSGDSDIFPMWFQRTHARASVSAGFRAAFKQGIIERAGEDGVGGAIWRLTESCKAAMSTDGMVMH